MLLKIKAISYFLYFTILVIMLVICSFKELVNKKNDKVKIKIIPKTNEEYISVKYGCISFIESYRFLSSNLDSLVKTLIDNIQRTLKNFIEEVVDNDGILNIANEIVEEDKTIKLFRKGYPDKMEKLEEALLIYMGEKGLKILKTGFPDKWKFLTKKLAYPYEFFNSLDDYQKPVNNLHKEEFFSKIENKYPTDKNTERTKEIIKNFNIKIGEELTRLYLKSDVLLLACVFENFMKVSVNEFGIIPLYFVSLPGYTWEYGLKYTGTNLQAFQDKHLIPTFENNIRGGKSSVMGDRSVKSDENKKILYIDATNLYGHSMIQHIPYVEIEVWHGHTDFYMRKLEEILNTPDDSDIGYFVEVDLKHPDNIKEKTKSFPFPPEKKSILKIIIMNI